MFSRKSSTEPTRTLLLDSTMGLTVPLTLSALVLTVTAIQNSLLEYSLFPQTIVFQFLKEV